MPSTPTSQTTVLLTRLGSRLCALPLADVVECMRPLPTEALPDMPPYLRGVSVIRGSPVPVVSLAALVGARGDAPVGRYVLVRLGERRVAAAVEEVVGVRRLDSAVLGSMPPLLQDASSESVTALGVRDEGLLFVLRMARVISDEVWQTLAQRGGSS